MRAALAKSILTIALLAVAIPTTGCKDRVGYGGYLPYSDNVSYSDWGFDFVFDFMDFGGWGGDEYYEEGYYEEGYYDDGGWDDWGGDDWGYDDWKGKKPDR